MDKGEERGVTYDILLVGTVLGVPSCTAGSLENKGKGILNGVLLSCSCPLEIKRGTVLVCEDRGGLVPCGVVRGLTLTT